MKVFMNELTQERLLTGLGSRPGSYKLYYDVEDCGCNGVLVLRIVSNPEPTDLPVEAGPFQFWVDAKQESLFDAEMRLEAEAGYPSFRLVSDASIISSNVRIMDARETVGV